jgi:hypothetical protein
MRSILIALAAALAPLMAASAPGYSVAEQHPRIFITHSGLAALAERCAGPLARDYAVVKGDADQAVRSGSIRWIDNAWAVPSDLLACGLAYLVERQGQRPCRQYADAIVKAWGDGQMIANQKGSAFGYHAIAYDWIYDALDDAQRTRYGNALAGWLTWFTGEAAITLKGGYWEYNQTWGPSHLNVMHSRDAITQKLLISLAIIGAKTEHQDQARRFLDSWATRIPNDCIPAFDAMGGSWAESHGHGSYGPITVIPYAFEAWRTATGQNLFLAGKPWSFLPEMSRWLTYLRVPHVDRHAFIDDGGGDRFSGFAGSAPIIARALRDPLAQWQAEQAAAGDSYQYSSWQRVALPDPSLAAKSPAALKLPLGYLFAGAGHVYMRSGWGDPNATWAFFGAGQHIAGHQHDDEGHFLISRKGGLAGKGGGRGGGNDEDHYWGGSLVFNLVTVFDPAEKPRRADGNENDGGLLRHVYEDKKIERGHITAFRHNEHFTYAAADLTAGYSPDKVKELTRQFIYLRGRPGRDEYFVVFDRVESTRPGFAKHFMLHVPAEPSVDGKATDSVPGHVTAYAGDSMTSSWLSRPDDFGTDAPVLSMGRSRLFMRTLLPKEAVITKRGGAGYGNWGHPLEPTAQYDHTGAGRDEAPLCGWRLEVAAPPAQRTCFLHVFQVSDDTVTAMEPVKLVDQSPVARLEIGSGQQRWKVALATQGALGGEITAPGATAAERLPADVETAPQYRCWQEATTAGGTQGRAPQAPSAAEAGAKPVPARQLPDPAAAAAWDAKLLARVRGLCAEDRGPTFEMSTVHDQVRIESADAAGTLQLRANGSLLTWKWAKLDGADRLRICLAIRSATDPDDQALTAFHLLCEGRTAEADDLLRGLPADQAATVRGAFSGATAAPP